MVPCKFASILETAHYKSFIKVMVLSGTFLLLTFLLAERPKVKTIQKTPIFSFCNK